jgi:hypothetical protein
MVFKLFKVVTFDQVIFDDGEYSDVARDTTVHIKPMDGSGFQFLNGTMFSDYAAQEAFKVSYFKGDQKLRPGEEKKLSWTAEEEPGHAA